MINNTPANSILMPQYKDKFNKIQIVIAARMKNGEHFIIDTPRAAQELYPVQPKRVRKPVQKPGYVRTETSSDNHARKIYVTEEEQNLVDNDAFVIRDDFNKLIVYYNGPDCYNELSWQNKLVYQSMMYRVFVSKKRQEWGGIEYGLYALEDIPKGALVCPYFGYWFPKSDNPINKEYITRRGILAHSRYALGTLGGKYDIIPVKWCPAGYANSPINFKTNKPYPGLAANVEAQELEETFDKNEYIIPDKLCLNSNNLIAKRDIKKGEQIFFDYGRNYAETKEHRDILRRSKIPDPGAHYQPDSPEITKEIPTPIVRTVHFDTATDEIEDIISTINRHSAIKSHSNGLLNRLNIIYENPNRLNVSGIDSINGIDITNDDAQLTAEELQRMQEEYQRLLEQDKIKYEVNDETDDDEDMKKILNDETDDDEDMKNIMNDNRNRVLENMITKRYRKLIGNSFDIYKNNIANKKKQHNIIEILDDDDDYGANNNNNMSEEEIDEDEKQRMMAVHKKVEKLKIPNWGVRKLLKSTSKFPFVPYNDPNFDYNDIARSAISNQLNKAPRIIFGDLTTQTVEQLKEIKDLAQSMLGAVYEPLRNKYYEKVYNDVWEELDKRKKEPTVATGVPLDTTITLNNNNNPPADTFEELLNSFFPHLSNSKFTVNGQPYMPNNGQDVRNIRKYAFTINGQPYRPNNGQDVRYIHNNAAAAVITAHVNNNNNNQHDDDIVDSDYDVAPIQVSQSSRAIITPQGGIQQTQTVLPNNQVIRTNTIIPPQQYNNNAIIPLVELQRQRAENVSRRLQQKRKAEQVLERLQQKKRADRAKEGIRRIQQQL